MFACFILRLIFPTFFPFENCNLIIYLINRWRYKRDKEKKSFHCTLPSFLFGFFPLVNTHKILDGLILQYIDFIATAMPLSQISIVQQKRCQHGNIIVLYTMYHGGATCTVRESFLTVMVANFLPTFYMNQRIS